MDPRIDLIRQHIRDVPDFPKPGILFRDITPMVASPRAFGAAVDLLVARYREQRLDHILAVESRGFIFGGPVALALGVPLHLVRKPGKLPCETDAVSYELEYGSNTVELHRDALGGGGRVLVLDDLLATGGTAAAAAQLAREQGGELVEAAFVVELDALGGRAKLAPTPCFSLLHF